jgi:hypothetical protein
MYIVRNVETVSLISKRLASQCHRFVKVREDIVAYFKTASEFAGCIEEVLLDKRSHNSVSGPVLYACREGQLDTQSGDGRDEKRN